MSSETEFESISFDLPKNQSNVIKVIGVGGGGSNAINHMFLQGIKGVDFYICNTDAQALQNSGVPNKIQLGLNLTEGLGAGANPDIGEQAAVESFDEISQMLDSNTKMVFITAGMGGGTGTGAAPIIAKMAKDKDILTVGIVTMPFHFEGKMRIEQSQKGIEKIRDVVDSLIVINNNKLREVYGNLGFKAGFSKADEVLSTAARGIAEVITHHYTQNIDLRDAKTVLSNSGTAIMGSAHATGEDRAIMAITKALDSPLLNDNKIRGAKNVLLLIVSGSEEITLDEIGEINDHIQLEAGNSANIIMGVGDDEKLEGAISVTVIATGFNLEQQDSIANLESKKIIHTLGNDQPTSTTRVEEERVSSSPVQRAVVPVQKEPEIIRHQLFEDTDEQLKQEDSIVVEYETKNTDTMSDFYDEPMPDFEDFQIIDLDQNSIDKESHQTPLDSHEEISISFDMPLNQDNQNDIGNSTGFDVANRSKELGVIRHTLEEEDVNNIVSITETTEQEPQIKADPKVLTPQAQEVRQPFDFSGVNPLDLPISHLKDSTPKRRAQMKGFNYKFNSPSENIDKIEKQPAYKRAGVNLNDVNTSSNMSRSSLSLDQNQDLQIRKNNSFLHDNVD